MELLKNKYIKTCFGISLVTRENLVTIVFILFELYDEKQINKKRHLVNQDTIFLISHIYDIYIFTNLFFILFILWRNLFYLQVWAINVFRRCSCWKIIWKVKIPNKENMSSFFMWGRKQKDKDTNAFWELCQYDRLVHITILMFILHLLSSLPLWVRE